MSSAICFNLDQSKILSSGNGLKARIVCSKELTHYQMTNYRLFQTERVCRQQFQVRQKWQKVIQMGRKHCGKRRNCSLRAIPPFSSVFKRLVFQGRQKTSLCGNGLSKFLLSGKGLSKG